MVCNSRSIYPRNFRAQLTYRLKMCSWLHKAYFFNFHTERKCEPFLHLGLEFKQRKKNKENLFADRDFKFLHLRSYSQNESEAIEGTGNLWSSQSTWQLWLISKVVKEGDSRSFSRVSCPLWYHRDRSEMTIHIPLREILPTIWEIWRKFWNI